MNLAGFLARWDEWARVWQAHALSQAGQVAVVIAAVGLLDACLRRRVRAAVRYAWWLLVPVKLLLSPELALPSSPAYWLRREAVIRAEAESPRSLDGWVTTETARGDVVHDQYLLLVGGRSVPVKPVSAVGMAAGIWLAGALGLACVVAWRSRQAGRRLSRGVPAEGRARKLLEAGCRVWRLGKAPRLVVSDELRGPAVCGGWQKTIVLPKGLASRLDDEGLRHVLWHELAHVRRGDLAWSWVQALLVIVNWMNPLVWLADRRIRELREQATDEAVVAALGGDAGGYAATLVEVAKGVPPRGLPLLGMVGIVEAPSSLGRRVRRLLDGRTSGQGSLGWKAWSLVLLLGALVLPLRGGPPKESEAPRPASRSATNESRLDLYRVEGRTPTLREQAEAGVKLEPPGRGERRWTKGDEGVPWEAKVIGDGILLELREDLPTEEAPRESWIAGLRARLRESKADVPDVTLRVRMPDRLRWSTMAAVLGAARAEGLKVVVERTLRGKGVEEVQAWPAPLLSAGGTNAAGAELKTRTYKLEFRGIDEALRRIGQRGTSVLGNLGAFLRSAGVSFEPPNSIYMSHAAQALVIRGTDRDIQAVDDALEFLGMQRPAMVEISAWVAEIPRDNLPPDLRALLKDAGSEGLPLKAQVAAGIRERWGAAGGRVWAMPRVTTLDGRSAEIEIGPVPEVKDGPPGGIPKSRLEMLAYRLANGASWSVEAKAAVGERAGAARKSIQDGDSVLLRLEATKEADGVVTVAIVTAVQIDPAGNRVHGVH